MIHSDNDTVKLMTAFFLSTEESFLAENFCFTYLICIVVGIYNYNVKYLRFMFTLDSKDDVDVPRQLRTFTHAVTEYCGHLPYVTNQIN